MDETEIRTAPPGTVIYCDGYLLRTRWNNWVTETGMILLDNDLDYDLKQGHQFTLVYWEEVFR